ncbi:FeoB-associated Cys-rich membrane protein [uncultured Clostridium sp.]|jgi:hypothetical protein|uniref:FeoB-associated Cys-rich membrane protein n=1 Tax=uncultured Clostridium sp. TaxID=59620 RepID=UPI00260F0348|nr:FeoB-associated Cys-rich membrane protein [uncultured Clostridium sp.]
MQIIITALIIIAVVYILFKSIKKSAKGSCSCSGSCSAKCPKEGSCNHNAPLTMKKDNKDK